MIDVYGVCVGDVEEYGEDDAWEAEDKGGDDEEFLGEPESGEGDVERGKKN